MLTQAAYARHRGVSRNAVHVAVRTGRIPPEAIVGKLLDREKADRAWVENVDVTKPRNSVTGSPHIESKNGHTPSAAATLNAQRAERESWQAKLARLDYERKAGLLVPAEDRDREGFQAGRAVRDAVLQVAKDVSTELAPAMPPLEVERILVAALRRALEQARATLMDPEPRGEAANGSREPAA